MHSAGATANRQVSANHLTVRDDRDGLLNAPPVQRGENPVEIGSLESENFRDFCPRPIFDSSIHPHFYGASVISPRELPA
jgi:hypothetical protein